MHQHSCANPDPTNGHSQAGAPGSFEDRAWALPLLKYQYIYSKRVKICCSLELNSAVRSDTSHVERFGVNFGSVGCYLAPCASIGVWSCEKWFWSCVRSKKAQMRRGNTHDEHKNKCGWSHRWTNITNWPLACPGVQRIQILIAG